LKLFERFHLGKKNSGLDIWMIQRFFRIYLFVTGEIMLHYCYLLSISTVLCHWLQWWNNYYMNWSRWVLF